MAVSGKPAPHRGHGRQKLHGDPRLTTRWSPAGLGDKSEDSG